MADYYQRYLWTSVHNYAWGSMFSKAHSFRPRLKSERLNGLSVSAQYLSCVVVHMTIIVKPTKIVLSSAWYNRTDARSSQ